MPPRFIASYVKMDEGRVDTYTALLEGLDVLSCLSELLRGHALWRPYISSCAFDVLAVGASSYCLVVSRTA